MEDEKSLARNPLGHTVVRIDVDDLQKSHLIPSTRDRIIRQILK